MTEQLSYRIRAACKRNGKRENKDIYSSNQSNTSIKSTARFNCSINIELFINLPRSTGRFNQMFGIGISFIPLIF